ncbi:MAG TPA: DUF4333 domain-containing protein [Mycobacteriales bacterium]|nr:DUF4333 domain-containing protein [Mycobacteriales bacterium]
MPDTEGTTCTSCFTLNPPGAPACIRCNQPLPEQNGAGTPLIVQPGTGMASPTDWPGAPPPAPAAPDGGGAGSGGQTGGPAGQPGGQPGGPARPAGSPGGPAGPGGTTGGAAELAPQGVVPGAGLYPDGYTGQLPPGQPPQPPTGLAVPPRGTPGGSRSAAAAVQPPGFGLGADGSDLAEQSGMSPAEQRRISRRIAIVGGIIVLLVLAGGGAALWLTRPKYLDTGPVANGIGTALTQRAGETVTVRCADTPRLKAGVTFDCLAIDRHGVTRTVKVTVLDTSGRYEWTLG